MNYNLKFIFHFSLNAGPSQVDNLDVGVPINVFLHQYEVPGSIRKSSSLKW